MHLLHKKIHRANDSIQLYNDDIEITSQLDNVISVFETYEKM